MSTAIVHHRPSGHLKRNGCNLGAHSRARPPAGIARFREARWSSRPAFQPASLRWQWDAFSSPEKTAMTKPSARFDP